MARNSINKVGPNNDVSKTPKNQKQKPVSIFQMWSYTNAWERMILCVGILSTIGAGSMIPLLEELLGGIANKLMFVTSLDRPDCRNRNISSSEQAKITENTYIELQSFTWKILSFGGGHFCCSYAYVAAFNYVAERQAHRLKSLYLLALFRQELEWRDKHLENKEENFLSTFLEDIARIQDATGEKIGLLLYVIFTSVISGVLSLLSTPFLAIVLGFLAPLMLTISGMIYRLEGRLAIEEETAFARVNNISNEALVNIRAVYAYNGQKKEIKKYGRSIDRKSALVRKRIYVEAIGSGLLWFLNFAGFAFAFWLGTELLVRGGGLCNIIYTDQVVEYSVQDILSCFKIVNGIFEICQYFAYINIISDGRSAAALIFSVCERVPDIDPFSEKGLKPFTPLKGRIELRKVSFYYASRPMQAALQDISLVIAPGVYCVVGPPGSGKSTLMNLLLRFYDPTDGKILFDGVNAKDYNLAWLRSQIGLISQDPVIFDGTVLDNVRFGKPDATMEEVFEACDTSCADEFISRLPQEYETVLGNGGIELSVYQKQRIAIARAVIRKPAILIFDEATKALETKNQSRWHRRLLESRQGLTTIIVAHLLPTLNQADCILSLQDGKLDEIGTNRDLIRSGKTYAKLYERLKGQEEREEKKEEKTKVQEKRSIVSRSITTLTSFFYKDASVQFNATKSDLDMELGAGAQKDSVIYSENMETLDGTPRVTSSPFWRLLKLGASEWHLIVMGFFMASLLGMTCPTYSILFGAVVNTIGEKSDKLAVTEVREYALTIFILGFTAAFTTASQSYCLTWASNQIIFHLRKSLFTSLLRQDIATFSLPQMNPNTLFSRIASEIATVNLALGSRLSLVVQALSTLVMTVTIAFQLHPTLGFCVLPIAPIVISVAVINVIITEKQVAREKVTADEISRAAFEAYSHFTTVAVLGREKVVVTGLEKKLEGPHRRARYLSHLYGLLHGISQSSLYFAYSGVVYFGTQVLRRNEIKFSDIFALGEALTWCTVALGQALAYSFNCGKARVSAKRVFQILDRKPRMHSGTQIPNRDISKAGIEFEKVDFALPLRPGLKLLDNCDILINPHEHVGIVGSVDCGKSVIIPLILRLYDVNSGTIKINGVDVREWNLKALRAQISVMFSQPMLFSRSVADNIAYGDNSRTVLVSEIVEVAKLAKIHDFIVSLPQSYNTIIGPGGYLLSDTQQHRIAFARAVLKRPCLLLLEDEARQDFESDITPVLDEYLHERGRNMMVVCATSELRAVQGFDRIIVLHVGQERETGTHKELVSRKSVYRKLWQLQNIGFHLE